VDPQASRRTARGGAFGPFSWAPTCSSRSPTRGSTTTYASPRDDPDCRAGLRTVETPILAVAGRGDRLLCREQAWRLFYRSVPNKTLRSFGREDTGFDPGHMTLVSDPRSRPMWHEIGRWLAGRLLRVTDNRRSG